MAETTTSTQTLVGYFKDHADADSALQALRDAGFSSAHLGVAHRGPGAPSGAGSTSSSSSDGPGVWNKIRNFFEGDSAEAYADEHTRGDLATREVTADPTAPDQYGSHDLHGSLNDMSVPQDRSRYFGQRFTEDEGGTIVTVNAGNRAAEAEAILRDNGADMGEDADEYTPAAETHDVEGTQNIQLLGEVLRVHKDRVSRGDVRIRKETITETQTIQVPVTREELVIERREVTGATPASGRVGDAQEIRIPLSEERAAVDKATVVREEVAVGKKSVSEVRNISDSVSHEELVVEDDTRRAVNE